MSSKFPHFKFRMNREIRKSDRTNKTDELNGNYVLEIQKKIQQLELIRAENEKRKALKISNIHLQRDKLISSVNELSSKFEARCTRDFVKTSKTLIELKIELEKRVEELQQKRNPFSLQGEILQSGLDLETKGGGCKPSYDMKISKDKTKFVEGKIRMSDLEAMFGSIVEEKKTGSRLFRYLSEKEEPSGSHDVTIAKISSFKHRDDAVISISPYISGMAWLNCLESNENTLVDTRGNVNDTRHVGRKGLDFITLQNGVHILTDNTDICMSESSNSVCVLVDTSPLYPCGINQTIDGNLLVTLVDETSFSSSKDSIRIVRILTTSGLVIQTYGLVKGGEQTFFTWPLRAVQNANLDICVVDRTGDSKGRICILHKDGDLKSVYDGQSSRKDFDPGDIACDPDYNIIVTDDGNSAVHLLNSEGRFMKFLLTRYEGIINPCSLALSQNTLWVGDWQGTIHVFKYNSTFRRNQDTENNLEKNWIML